MTAAWWAWSARARRPARQWLIDEKSMRRRSPTGPAPMSGRGSPTAFAERERYRTFVSLSD
jgi:hypothetical protein